MSQYNWGKEPSTDAVPGGARGTWQCGMCSWQDRDSSWLGLKSERQQSLYANMTCLSMKFLVVILGVSASALAAATWKRQSLNDGEACTSDALCKSGMLYLRSTLLHQVLNHYVRRCLCFRNQRVRTDLWRVKLAPELRLLGEQTMSIRLLLRRKWSWTSLSMSPAFGKGTTAQRRRCLCYGLVV